MAPQNESVSSLEKLNTTDSRKEKFYRDVGTDVNSTVGPSHHQLYLIHLKVNDSIIPVWRIRLVPIMH